LELRVTSPPRSFLAKANVSKANIPDIVNLLSASLKIKSCAGIFHLREQDAPQGVDKSPW
jgi:hypothetical protein